MMMNIKHIQSRFLVILLSLITGILLQSPFSMAKQTPESPFDMIIKISQLEKTLDIIDELALADPSKPMASPTTLIRGMLQGSGWIDPDRMIVIGVEMRNFQPIGTALVPFRRSNTDFQTTFRASSGPDYYILSCPPGQEVNISREVESVLVAASRSKSSISISAEFRVSELLKKEESNIQQALQNLENMPIDKAGKPAPKPQEIKCMIKNILDTARQLESFTLGLDFNQRKITSFFEAKARKETELAKLFEQSGKTTRLGNYKPQHQINFRSRSYDIEGATEFMNALLGDFYKSLGIDFPSLIAICNSFTGEMAGGMSTSGETGAEFEMISVLKETKATDDFLDAVYLPGLEKYSKSFTAMMEKQFPGQSAELFVRTPDSIVAGHKVVGIKTQAPLFLKNNNQEISDSIGLMKYEMRMTTVENLLFVAPDDKRIDELIRVAKTFKESPSEGSLMTFDIDVAGYINSVMKILPVSSGGIRPLPRMGRIIASFDAKNGRVVGKSSIMIDDIKKIIVHFENLPTSVQTCNVEKKAGNQITTDKENVAEIVQKTEKEPVEPEPAVTEKDVAYWSDKGSLCAVYGNDKAAIEYFKKAIELEPRKSETYFLLGVSYGEIGNYAGAISSINKALELNPEKALYYYGRGRVYLLSSERDRAMGDFKLAARLGNRDAQNYLNKSRACLQ